MLISAIPPPGKSDRPEDEQAKLIGLWTKTEDVAMHFNELILNFRLKALGAVTVGAGLFGSVLLTREHLSTRMNFGLFASAMAFLALVWIGIWAIDSGYYQRLLRGAVKEAIRLEEAIGGLDATAFTGDMIRLSRTIEDVVDGRPVKGDTASQARNRWSRALFYAFPLGAFVVAAVATAILAIQAPAETTGGKGESAGNSASQTQTPRPVRGE